MGAMDPETLISKKNSIKGAITRLKILNLLTLMLIAAKVKFFPLLLEEEGISASEIGVILGIGSIAQLIATPLWGVLFDLFHHSALVLGFGLACWALLVQAFSIKNLLKLHPVVYGSIYALLMGTEASISLVDTMSASFAAKSKDDTYGEARWLASLGFGLGCVFSGYFIETFGFSSLFLWSIVFGISAVCASFALETVAREHTNTEASPWKNKENKSKIPLSSSLINLLMNCIGYGNLICLVDVIVVLHIQQAHSISKTFIGILSLIGTTSEIPVFYYSQRLIKTFKRQGSMFCACVSMCIRMIILAIMSTIESPNIMLFSLLILQQCFHGMALAPYFSAAVDKIDTITKSESKGKLMGLLLMCFFPLGWALGSVFWGYIYETFGSFWVYTLGCAVSLAVAVHAFVSSCFI